MKNVPKPSKKAVCLPGANLASMELTRTQLREPDLDFSAFQESLRIQGVLAGSGPAPSVAGAGDRTDWAGVSIVTIILSCPHVWM